MPGHIGPEPECCIRCSGQDKGDLLIPSLARQLARKNFCFGPDPECCIRCSGQGTTSFHCPGQFLNVVFAAAASRKTKRCAVNRLYLPASQPACLPACQPASLPASQPACLRSQPASQPASLPAKPGPFGPFGPGSRPRVPARGGGGGGPRLFCQFLFTPGPPERERETSYDISTYYGTTRDRFSILLMFSGS